MTIWSFTSKRLKASAFLAKILLTHSEKCDIMEHYTVCQKMVISYRARKNYSSLFPMLNLPDRMYFVLLFDNFINHLYKFIISEATEINSLAYFQTISY